MRNRTLALIVTITALTSVVASCGSLTDPGQEQLPDCSAETFSIEGYGGFLEPYFNDTLAVGDTIRIRVYRLRPEQETGFLGPYWTCVQGDAISPTAVSWSSDDARVATVVNGLVKASQPGSTAIHGAVIGGGQGFEQPLVVVAPAKAEARAISSRLLAPHGREVRSGIHREPGLAGDGLPHQPIGHDLGALITRTPALEDA